MQAARLRDNQPELPHGRRAHGCYMARGGAVTVVGLRGEPGHRRTTSSTRDHLASPPTAHVVRHRRLLELPCAPRAGVNVAVWEQVSAKRVRERGRRCASAVLTADWWWMGSQGVYGCTCMPIYRTLMTRGREEAYGEAVDAVLAWPFSRVVGPATARSSERS